MSSRNDAVPHACPRPDPFHVWTDSCRPDQAVRLRCPRSRVVDTRWGKRLYLNCACCDRETPGWTLDHPMMSLVSGATTLLAVPSLSNRSDFNAGGRDPRREWEGDTSRTQPSRGSSYWGFSGGIRALILFTEGQTMVVQRFSGATDVR